MTPYSDNLWHGASWYPELWPDDLEADLSKMSELGLNCLRLGDSVWGVLEPSDGTFTLDWYAGVLDRIHAAGLKFILTTPTYTPPRWLTRDYPDAVRIDKDGLPFLHGSRGHGSHASPSYLRLATRIAEKMAERFGNHPGLLAWQIDNEVACHVDGDFSPAALAAWHEWLEKRFGTIAELNRRWGTRVWDQHYNAFSEVQPPGKTPYGHTAGTATGEHNPSLMVAWGEFWSDTTVAFIRAQADAIRRHSTAPITHNHIQLERTCPADLFAQLDIVSTDSYWWPGTAQGHHRSIAWMRGLKRRADGTPKPFWLLETTPFQIGGLAVGPLKVPGFQLAEAALFTGGGTTAHLYWLWRQQRTGIESSHGAILTAWGTPTPAWDEIKSVSAFFQKAAPLLTGIPPAIPDIALHDPKLSKQLMLRGSSMYGGTDAQWTYRREVDDPLMAGGWAHDILPEGGDPLLYKVVLTPWMPIMTESLVAQMLAWVERGGTWIVGPASALRDECAAVFTDCGMGPLERALGFRTLFWQQADNINGTLGDKELPLKGLAYALDPGACRALGHYTSSYAQGHAWAVEKNVGAGRVVVYAAFPKGLYGELLEHALGTSAIPRHRTSGLGVFLLPRESRDGRRGYIATNTELVDGWVDALYAGTDLLTGKSIPAGRIALPSMGVLAVLGEPAATSSSQTSKWLLEVKPAPCCPAFELEDYWVWDNSIAQGPDGLWHLFTTRWPKNTPYSPYWLYLTEIIRCVADRPEGPYRMVATLFPERVRDRWDGMASHNPVVLPWGGRWYLFYRGITFDGPVPGPENPEPDLSDRFWSDWKRKAIGVAVSDSLEGPWDRSAAPILAPRLDHWDRFCCSNPAPCILTDGTTYLIYKTRSAMDGPFLLGIARAPHPLGPYERLGTGPILGGAADNNFEDAYLWHDGSRFHLIAKDMSGVSTGEYHAGIHAVSDDAVTWTLTQPLPVYSLTVDYEDGSRRKLGSFERPSLVFENGQPTWLIGSAGDGPGGFWNASRTWIASVPVRLAPTSARLGLAEPAHPHVHE